MNLIQLNLHNRQLKILQAEAYFILISSKCPDEVSLLPGKALAIEKHFFSVVLEITFHKRQLTGVLSFSLYIFQQLNVFNLLNPIHTGLFLHPICTGGGQICPPI